MLRYACLMARLKNLNRTAVFLRRQDPSVDSPAHWAGKALAQMLLKYSLACLVAERQKDYRSAIQLRTEEAWAVTKERFRGAEKQITQKLLPALEFYSCFMQSYPPAPKSFEEKMRQQELWMNAERF